MAITVTKLSHSPVFFQAGMTGIEYSITFDTAYAATGGEALSFGTNTNFVTKCRGMFVTKPPRNTNVLFYAELARGTGDTASAAKLQLFELENSATNATKVAYTEVSTTTDMSAVKMRAIFYGY